MIDTIIENKTWSEIKLRKPSQEICDNMQLIMSDFSEISASKALERLIVSYPNHQMKISDLESYNAELKSKVWNLENQIKEKNRIIESIRQAYKCFTDLIS